MAISKSTFVLTAKRQLTHDVFELSFRSSDTSLRAKAGEYIIFTLVNPAGETVKRAYSIAYEQEGLFTFVIKRVAEGKGSPVICDAEIGTELEAMGPMGHFTLRETEASKCFIGTGTGFAPLYFQLRRTSDLFPNTQTKFVFGIREEKDMFYLEEIEDLKKRLPNFSNEFYLSRAEVAGTKKGYVTEFITSENIAKYQEYYLCGSPTMVKESRAKLEELGVPKENIFFEQF